MLTAMKILILKNLVLLALIAACNANAGLYKGLDEEGNVVYSDKPFADSQKFTPPAITIVDAPKVIVKEELAEEDLIEKDKQAETKYTTFSISSPTNDQTIWNEPDLAVSLQLSPALNTAEGHTIWLLMDGKPLVEKSSSLLLQVGRSDRGEHSLQAQVRNKKGKVIKRSKTITVHIKHSTVRKPKPPTGEPKPAPF